MKTLSESEPETAELTDTQKIAAHARALAAALDVLHDLGVEAPTHFDIYPWLPLPLAQWLIWSEDGQKDRAAAIIRTVGGKWDKSTGSSKFFKFTTTFSGVRLEVTVDRAEVCERVVTGTTTVIKPAVAAVPETVEEVEAVEWRCAPILSGVSA